MEYVRSRKGKSLLKDMSGYTYRVLKVQRSGKILWRCTKNSGKDGACKASVHSLNDVIVFRNPQDHNHVPDNL